MLYNHIIGGKSVAIPTRPQLVPEVERDGSHCAGIECGLVVEAVVAEVLNSGVAVVAPLTQQRWRARRDGLLAKSWEALLCRSRAT